MHLENEDMDNKEIMGKFLLSILTITWIFKMPIFGFSFILYIDCINLVLYQK
jgi:hypothetical protein